MPWFTVSIWARCWLEPNTVAILKNGLKALLAELKKQPNSILFIDEIHTIIGAGAASRWGDGRQ